MDIESKGSAFTWFNNREGEELVKKRLERVLGNMEWGVSFPNAEAFALPAVGSDHSPILLSLYQNSRVRKKDFKFEAYWMEDEEYDMIVQQAWLNVDGERGDFASRMERVTASLISWSRKKFSNAYRQIESLKRLPVDIAK